MTSSVRTVDDHKRVAMFDVWNGRCVWCTRPLSFDAMEIEHLVPKSLAEAGLAATLAHYGLPLEFDLNSLPNLAPSCGPCNRGKGSRPVGNAPVIRRLLDDAERRAPVIEQAAAALREDKKVARALAIVRGAAAGGNERARVELAAAADQVYKSYEAATGRPLARLDVTLAELGGTDDGAFAYITIKEPSGRPSRLSEGTVLSFATTEDGRTLRTDVVPLGDENSGQHEIAFTLTPTADETGEAAAALLDAGLREGRRLIEVDSGLDVTLDRLPPGMAGHEGERLTGASVRLIKQMPPRPWRARLRMRGRAITRSLDVDLHPIPPQDGWDIGFAGSSGGVIVTVFARASEHEDGEMQVSLSHHHDGSAAQEQLDALRFMDAFQDGGVLSLGKPGSAKADQVEVAVESLSDTGQTDPAFVAFLEDVRTVERWARVGLALAVTIVARDVADVAAAAALIRARGRDLRWHAAELIADPAVLDKLGEPAPAVVERDVVERLLGQDVHLGRGTRTLGPIKVLGVEPVDDPPGFLRVSVGPATGEPERVREQLRRPERSPIRPKPANGSRKRRAHGR